ncbi:juvenile hormone acid O-methyltransferase-like [Rhipicephalus sanguineus]|uniref:juvenile hormone acid O-methyltransferase-like n=1 Tax=Rhipicephalus sanguineus TaxID=34632 RepID=UPI0020C45AC4|nr:juvenile hormone acid O-methyltransferase-like [Rhipicephalus sanguineus]
MDENVQSNDDKPGYDAATYSKYVTCDFPTITKLLKYYNMTFDNVLDGDIGRERTTSRGPRQFLDIGSGCGVVTKKILLPSVPDDVEKIVGVDLCENMLSYARQRNSHPKIVYEKLDIRGDVSEFLDLYGPFDRIYGFNSLNRVKEQSKAWNNMAKLLKPGGECLLFYSAWFVTPNIWRALAKKKRWSRFAEMLPSFDESTDKWNPYFIKAEAYFYANGIA